MFQGDSIERIDLLRGRREKIEVNTVCNDWRTTIQGGAHPELRKHLAIGNSITVLVNSFRTNRSKYGIVEGLAYGWVR